MTACVLETAVDDDTAPVPPTALVIAADGSYAARLLPDPGSGGLLTERWTLGGPEPYAVRLPGTRPEEPDSSVLPLADGRVLIRRFGDGRHIFSLLYPTGPGTGELPVGGVACEWLTLLPPAPDGAGAYALAPGEHSTALWLVHGGSFGPELLTDIPGHCSGGAWLDRTGRMLALDRTLDGRTKAIALDLERGGEISPLLQITEDSDDRLVLAEPDSGLLLLRSDAPGEDRLGWGVLGSARPVRFPDSLRDGGAAARAWTGAGAGAAAGSGSGDGLSFGRGAGSVVGAGPARAAGVGLTMTPFAVQPGQILMPESCGVALRVDGPGGSRVGAWRPAEGRLRLLDAPDGWLTGTGLWTPEGELRLPYATVDAPCGLARTAAPARPDRVRAHTPGAPPGPMPGPMPGPVPGARLGTAFRRRPRLPAPATGGSTGAGRTPGPPSAAVPRTEPGGTTGNVPENRPGNGSYDVREAERTMPLRPVPLQEMPAAGEGRVG